jgi:hypothetical protein
MKKNKYSKVLLPIVILSSCGNDNKNNQKGNTKTVSSLEKSPSKEILSFKNENIKNYEDSIQTKPKDTFSEKDKGNHLSYPEEIHELIKKVEIKLTSIRKDCITNQSNIVVYSADGTKHEKEAEEKFLNYIDKHQKEIKENIEILKEFIEKKIKNKEIKESINFLKNLLNDEFVSTDLYVEAILYILFREKHLNKKEDQDVIDNFFYNKCLDTHSLLSLLDQTNISDFMMGIRGSEQDFKEQIQMMEEKENLREMIKNYNGEEKSLKEIENMIKQVSSKKK